MSPGADDEPGAIDLRPLFAPRSIAVVGASPRSWIAETVRDNLRVMDSETRCHFVNPKYEELHGQLCYPSLDALPERPDVAVVALNPLRAASVTEAAAAGTCASTRRSASSASCASTGSGRARPRSSG